jgi:hypothetical protein
MGTLQHGTPKKGYFATWHPEKRVLCNMATPKKGTLQHGNPKKGYFATWQPQKRVLCNFLHSTLFTSILGFENKYQRNNLKQKKGTLQYV